MHLRATLFLSLPLPFLVFSADIASALGTSENGSEGRPSHQTTISPMQTLAHGAGPAPVESGFPFGVVDAHSSPILASGSQADADRLRQQGYEAYTAGEFDSAIDYYQQALAINQQRDWNNEEETLKSLMGLRNAFIRQGQYDQAINSYQLTLEWIQGRSILRTHSRTPFGHRLEMFVLRDLSRLYAASEQYPQAIETYQRLLDLARYIRPDLTGFRGYWEVTALLGLGDSYAIAGDYEAALDTYNQLIERLTLNWNTAWRPEYVFPEGSAGWVASNRILGRLGMANVYALQGNYPQARETLNLADNWFMNLFAMLGNEPAGLAEVLQRSGDVYLNLGDYQQAIESYEKALRSVDASAEGTEWLNSIEAYGRDQDSIERDSEFMSVVAQRAYLLNNERLITAASLAGLSNTYRSLGQMDEADRYQQEATALYAELDIIFPLRSALARTRAMGGRAREVRAFVSQGDEAIARGDQAQALSDYQAGLQMASEIGLRREESLALLGLGDAHQGLNDPESALDAYQQGLAIAREIGGREVEARALNSLGWLYLNQEAIDEAETYLGEAVTAFDSLRGTVQADASKVSLFDRQVGAYRGLEQVYILQNRPEAALEASERGRARAFIDMLAQNLSQQQQEPFTATPPDLAAIQAIARTERSVLVQYSLVETGPDGPSIYIWVVQPSGQMDFRKMSLTAATANVAELISTSRDSLGVRSRGFELAMAAPTTVDHSAQLRQLHQLLIDPIADLLPTNPRDRVVFIPQGPLFLVPFAALQNEEGQYLIERHTILNAPSIQALALSRQQRAPRRIGSTYTPQRLLLVGNPTMPTVGNSATPLTPLPGSEQEVLAIANVYRAEPLIGDQATEAAVKQRVGEAMVVHLATHGLLEYGGGGTQDIPGAIALAPGDGEDGLLTSAEILETIKLNAELVVLSACDTGRGDITGDGVIGLSRSLMAAGAPTVIVSLWAVPDAPTAQLMTAFYRHLLLEETRDQALRQAMLETLQTHPDPLNWAAFTFMGLGE